ncbi:MAG: ABC transporter substrate-binding protein [Candidatus Tectomicrobia bacterium]|nr:ABC transporter substrate-binding protein [Candidatus Tectomicrobia bacterium]
MRRGKVSRAAIFTGLFFFSLSVPARAERVVAMMDWILNGKHSPFFAGVKKGFYKADGLEPDIIRGRGSGDTAKTVATGQADYGFADSGVVIVGRTRGLDAKMLAIIHDRAPHAIFSVKGKGFQKPTDFIGKKFGGAKADAVRIIFPAFAQVNGYKGSDVEWIDMPGTAKTSSLLSGRVDAITNYVTDGVAIKASARKVGLEISTLLFRDHGLDLYSNGLLASDERIQRNPDQAGRFVRATMKAWAWSVENPKEALDIFMAQTPTLARSIAEGQLMLALDMLLSDYSKVHGIGHFDEKKMQQTIDVLAKYMNLPRKPSPSEVYTNGFLPKLFPKKP